MEQFGKFFAELVGLSIGARNIPAFFVVLNIALREWYERLRYTLDHIGTYTLGKWFLTGALIEFFALGLALSKEQWYDILPVFGPAMAVNLLMCVYALIAVRPVTAAERDAVRGSGLSAAQVRAWEQRQGIPRIGFLTAARVFYFSGAIRGFSLFFGALRIYQAHHEQLGPFAARLKVLPEFCIGVIFYAGPLWFMFLYAIEVAIGPLFRGANHVERAIIHVITLIQSKLTGEDVKTIEARDLTRNKMYDNTSRSGADVLKNTYMRFLGQLRLTGILQVFNAWFTMSKLAVEVSFFVSILLLFFELAVTSVGMDHVPMRHIEERWARVIRKLPIVPQIVSIFIFGNWTEALFLPLFAAQLVVKFAPVINAASSATTAATPAAKVAGHGVGIYFHALMGLKLKGFLLLSCAVAIIALVLIKLFGERLSESLEKIHVGWVRKAAAVIAVLLLMGPAIGGVAHALLMPVNYVAEHERVGNLYVNRNQIGAVVGAQPFGGEGLSGTGPKAGGPNYLARFATERVRATDITATGGNVQLLGLAGKG